MFKVDGYKISFWHFVGVTPIPKLGMVTRHITSCSIRTDEQLKESLDIMSGLTILNPIDSYDKVIDKKIALTRAIQPLDKSVRTEIWYAFWEWVESWKL